MVVRPWALSHEQKPVALAEDLRLLRGQIVEASRQLIRQHALVSIVGLVPGALNVTLMCQELIVDLDSSLLRILNYLVASVGL